MYLPTICKCKRFYPLFESSLTNFSLLYYTAIRVNPSWTSRNVSPVATIIQRGRVPNFKSSCHEAHYYHPPIPHREYVSAITILVTIFLHTCHSASTRELRHVQITYSERSLIFLRSCPSSCTDNNLIDVSIIFESRGQHASRPNGFTRDSLGIALLAIDRENARTDT